MRSTSFSTITKNAERKRRGKSKEVVVLNVISPNQNVPVVIENFRSSSVSKTAFQAFYVEWLTTKYNGSKPLYLGISPQVWVVPAGHAALFPHLNYTHKEADDRIMLHLKGGGTSCAHMVAKGSYLQKYLHHRL